MTDPAPNVESLVQRMRCSCDTITVDFPREHRGQRVNVKCQRCAALDAYRGVREERTRLEAASLLCDIFHDNPDEQRKRLDTCERAAAVRALEGALTLIRSRRHGGPKQRKHDAGIDEAAGIVSRLAAAKGAT